MKEHKQRLVIESEILDHSIISEAVGQWHACLSNCVRTNADILSININSNAHLEVSDSCYMIFE